MQFLAFNQKKRYKAPPEINLTSLVDIIFNLLLFFMLTTSIGKTPSIKLDLPTAKAGQKDQNKKSLDISISAKSEILLNNELVSEEILASKLKEAQKDEIEVIITADKSASHGQVVQVLDLIKENGIGQISIATKRPKTN